MVRCSEGTISGIVKALSESGRPFDRVRFTDQCKDFDWVMQHMRSEDHEQRFGEKFGRDEGAGWVVPGRATNRKGHREPRLRTVARAAALRLHRYLRGRVAEGKPRVIIGISFGATLEHVIEQ